MSTTNSKSRGAVIAGVLAVLGKGGIVATEHLNPSLLKGVAIAGEQLAEHPSTASAVAHVAEAGAHSAGTLAVGAEQTAKEAPHFVGNQTVVKLMQGAKKVGGSNMLKPRTAQEEAESLTRAAMRAARYRGFRHDDRDKSR